MQFINKIIKISIISTLVLGTHAQAGTTTWNFDLEAIDSTKLKVAGTNGSATLNGDLIAFSDTGGTNDNKLEQSSSLPAYGVGFGMKNQDSEGGSPQHAFDNEGSGGDLTCGGRNWTAVTDTDGNITNCTHNSNGRERDPFEKRDFDAALVSFDTSVELTEVGFSWAFNTTTDFNVLAFTGAGAPPPLVNTTWNRLDSGWSLIGSYRATSISADYYAINNGGVSSQHWLISTFNNALDSNYKDVAGNKIDNNDTDAFKLEGLKGRTTTDVSAPGAFGLLLVGMLGLYSRRKKV